MSNANKAANRIFLTAQNQLNKDYQLFVNRLERNEGTSVGDFMERVLEWTQDSQRHQWLWVIFHEAFNVDNNLEFFNSFGSFVGNCLLDDSSFSIEWRKTDFLVSSVEVPGKENYEEWSLQYFPNGDLKTKLTTKDDPKGRPLVIWARTDGPEAKHDPKLLMEAMDIHEARQLQRIKEIEEEMLED